ncbi:MAG: PKD domain-containing protein [Saprospiraceae bacterium]|nr:PKD domain-containing protein [Saprospiraceae bacterium]
MKLKLLLGLLCVTCLGTIPTLITAQTASITSGCPPLTVNFTPPNNVDAYFWDFGNNVTSTLALPATTYTEPGVYTVSFRAGAGEPVLGTINIQVLPPPDLNIAIDTAFGCAPLAITFTNTSQIDDLIEVNRYSWGFGDGGSDNGISNVSHTYESAGTFTPSLSVSTNQPGCDVTKNFPELIQVNRVENVRFATSPPIPTACDPPLEVAFTNTTPDQNLQFSWDLGNGQASNAITPPNQTYTAYQRYTVTRTATDELGCQASFASQVNVGKPIANFSIRDTFCLEDTIQIANLSGPGNYRWDFGSAASPVISTEDSPSVTFKEKGFFPVTLTVTDPVRGCESDTTITVCVDKPDASFTSDPSYTCNDSLLINFQPDQLDAESYIWVFADGETSTEQRPSHQFVIPDSSIYGENGRNVLYSTLFVRNVSGCRDTFFAPDTIFMPNALFMPNRIDGCAPLSVTFSDSSRSMEQIIAWEYDYGDGSSASLNSDEPHAHVYNEPGTYDVVLNITNTDGCVDTSYALRIEVGEALSPDFSVDKTEICPGETVQFTNLTPPDSVDAWHFETDVGRSFHCYQEPELAWTFEEETGPMDVSLTVEYNGCQSSTVKEDLILVKGPIARIDYEMDCSDPFSYTIIDSSYNASILHWDLGDGSSNSGTAVRFTHPYRDTGDYQLILRAENPASGCAASSDTTIIHVRDITSDFSFSRDEICQGTRLNLNAQSSLNVDPTCWKGYTWLFDISGRPVQTHLDTLIFTFNQPGVETIRLVTEDINGCTDTSTQQLKIFDVEAAFATDDNLICFPAEVNFTDETQADTVITDYQWSFGGGGFSSEANPIHIYDGSFSEGDTIAVKLTVTDALGCTSQAADSLVVYQPRSFIITDPPFANACVGEEIKFFGVDYTAGGSGLEFTWDYRDGSLGSGINDIHSYSNEGDYIVRMTYAEIGSGCGGVDSVLASIQAPPEAQFSSNVDNDPFVCFPSQVQFTNTSTASSILFHQWDFGNGQQSTDKNPLASFEKGTFDIRLISATTFGCADTAYSSITLIGPEGDFAFEPEGICEGGTATFTLLDTVDVNSFSWDFGDGSPLVDGESPIMHTYENIPVLGPRPVTLILRSAENDCVTTVTKPITIFETRADFLINGGLDSVFCATTLDLNDNSTQANEFSWNFGNGMISTEQNPSIVLSPGEYEIQLAVANSDVGCRDTVARQVSIIELEDIAIQQDTICLGDTTQLSLVVSQEDYVFNWLGPDILEDPSLAMPLASPAMTSSYSVQIRDSLGCTAEVDGFIYVIEPLIWSGQDTSICVGESLSFPDPPNPEGLYEFSWSPPLPYVVNEGDSLLTLAISDVVGCFFDEYEYDIRSLTGLVKVPNVFTPNGDSYNDVFKAYTDLDVNEDEEIEILNMRIWNRWGQIVYQSQGPDSVWDGTHNGSPAPSDVYVYTIEMEVKICGEKGIQIRRGDVTLAR